MLIARAIPLLCVCFLSLGEHVVVVIWALCDNC